VSPIQLVRRSLFIACTVVLASFSHLASAEVSEVRIARQFGLAHLPLMIMEEKRLIEAAGAKRGLPQLKGVFHQLASTGGINDALLAGQLDFAPNGGPSLLTIWDKTRGTSNEVRGLVAVNEFSFFLNANRPGLKSVRDFTDNDRIVVSAIKVSVPAILLQIAAQKEWGKDQYARLDKLTVAMPHPDGMAALVSKREVTAHFTSPPFMHQELERPGIYKVLSSDDILGGPAVGTILFGTTRFATANPLATQAVYDAATEAVNFINNNKRAAAEIYLRMSKDKSSVDEIVRQISDPSLSFSTTPRNFMTYAKFMHGIGSIKNLPASWKDVFFRNGHDLAGS
jgi:NitT/TauT family transport system substrate-binding protein